MNFNILYWALPCWEVWKNDIQASMQNIYKYALALKTVNYLGKFRVLGKLLHYLDYSGKSKINAT